MKKSFLPLSYLGQTNGFAVIIVLILSTFILMLSITLTLSVSASNSQVNAKINQLIAEKNSIFSLKVALGNLQKHAGPDQRITAPAAILPSVTPSKEQMIGIWNTTNQNNIFWLSSDYQEGENNFLRQAAPSSDAEDAVVLLGEGTLGEDAEQLHVVNNLSLIQSSDSNEDPTSRYAWWIDDEGLKAKVTPKTDYNNNFDKYSSLLARQHPRQPNLKKILPSQIARPDFNSQLEKLHTSKSLEIIGLDNNDQAEGFESFSIWSKGVLSNVKDGGLKKDLSLAFEMDDNDFERSEFARGGEDSIPVDGIRVQPIFVEKEKGSGLEANGPAWHLLRDYYRLYHKIENPLGNPTLDAQTFLPNLGTDTFPTSASFSRFDWSALAPMTFVADSSDDISELISPGQVSKDTVVKNAASGDPLVVTNGNTLPILYQASYLPYFLRAGFEFGIQFQPSTGANAGSFTPNILSRESYSFHNPYNVSIRHQGLYSHLEMLRFRFVVRPQGGNNTGRANNAGNNSNAVKVLPGTIAPGEVTLFQGLTAGNSAESPSGVDIDWEFVDNPESIAGNNRQQTYQSTDNAESEIRTWFGRGRSVLRFGFLNGIGFKGKPISSGFNRTNSNLNTELRFYNGVFSDDITPAYNNWLGDILIDDLNQNPFPSGAGDAVSAPYGVSQFNNVTGAVASILFFDFRFAAAEDEFNFPAFTMNNPLAPILMNQNLLNSPSTTSTNVNTSSGFPFYAPGLNIRMSQTNINGLTVIESNGNNGYWGNSYKSSTGKTSITLIDLPTTPPLSLAKLQNANISVYAHMPYFAIGNSFASPFLDTKDKITTFQNREGSNRVFYDLSYLANEALWDDYFFSSYSIPYNAGQDDFNETSDSVRDTFDAAFNTGNQNRNSFNGSLPNQNMKLYRNNEDLRDISEKLFDSSGDPQSDGYLRAAENLLVDGAFNIHSTSEEAWVAMLSAAQGVDLYRYDSQSSTNVSDQLSPIGRLTQTTQDAFRKSNNSNNSNAWGGTRVLDEGEIRDLAQNIISAIKDRVSKRGRPYLSMAELINRELANGSTGKSGVLQEAIDSSRINDPLNSNSAAVSQQDLKDNINQILFPNPDSISTSAGNARGATTGASSAAITQADLLEAIAASINVRSDTFTIRSYGDHIDPITKKVLAKAYCEAVVQRVPEPVQPKNRSNDPSQADFWEPEQDDLFGRKFKIVSLRWLSESDI